MGSLALLGWLGVAAAGDAGLASALSQMVSGAGPRAPDMAVACGPTGALLDRLTEMSAIAAAAGRPMPEEVASLLGDPVRAAELGLDPQGVVGFGLYLAERQGWLSLPLSSADPETAERLMGALGVQFSADSAGWSIEGGEARAALRGPDLVLQRGQGSTGAIFDPTLLSDLPTSAGCLMWGANRPGMGLPVQGDVPFQTGLFVPLDHGQDLQLRLRLKDPAPGVLDHPASAPVGGTTSEPPSLVVAAGVSLRSLVKDRGVARALELSERDARRLVRALDVGPGSTLALFGPLDPERLDWVAVVPVEGALAPRRIARKGRRILRGLDMRVKRGAANAFVAEGDEGLVFGVADHGRLVLGRDPVRVMEAASGVGGSWLAEADDQRLGAWPIVAWTGSAMPTWMGLPESARVDLGLRAVGGVWEIGLRATGLAEAWRQLMDGELKDAVAPRADDIAI